jgi:rhodanese-related sulfurtransferase
LYFQVQYRHASQVRNNNAYLTPIEKSLDKEFVEVHQGPTDTSNWLIPNRILMSAYPSDKEEAKALLKSRQLLNGGIRIFVCLQQKTELQRFKHYRTDVENEFKNMVQQNDNLDFIIFEIPDNYYADDIDVDNFTNELVERFHKGQNILIHCWGGHGRTGTISAILLSKLYGTGAEESLRRVQAVHDCRIEPRGSRSPQTDGQINQVKRLVKRYLVKKNGQTEIEEPVEKFVDEKKAFKFERGNMKMMIRYDRLSFIFKD